MLISNKEKGFYIYQAHAHNIHIVYIAYTLCNNYVHIYLKYSLFKEMQQNESKFHDVKINWRKKQHISITKEKLEKIMCSNIVCTYLFVN